MTAREHLEMFAAIKRVPANKRKEIIEDRLKDVLLLDVADKLASTFSGGMKSTRFLLLQCIEPEQEDSALQ